MGLCDEVFFLARAIVRCYATALPGGLPVTPELAAQFSEQWGFDVPSQPGFATVEALERATQGRLDALYAIGGNFLETMPNPDRIRAGLARIPLRVHRLAADVASPFRAEAGLDV